MNSVIDSGDNSNVTSEEAEEEFVAWREGELEEASGPFVLLLHDKFVRGAATETPGVAHAALSWILTWAFPSDTHFAAYGGQVDARMTNAVLREGGSVQMKLAVFDVDCRVAHQMNGADTSSATADWFKDERPKIEALLAVHAGGFVYCTKGGYRIVYALPESVEIASDADRARWTLLYIRWVTYLKRQFGIVADPACSDCTRLYRAPHATRDEAAGPEEREIIGNPADVGCWAYVPPSDSIDDDIAAASEVAMRDPNWRGRALKPLLRLKHGEASPSNSRSAARPRAEKSEMPPTLPLTALDVSARRARLYIARMPAAVSGEGGHQAAFKVALVLTKGFSLSEETALTLMVNDYNPRCVPPWSLGELRHKISSAAASSAVPDGWLTRRPAKDLLTGSAAHVPRPEIVIRTDEHEVVSEAITALAMSERVYQRAGMLVQVTHDPAKLRGVSASPGAPLISELPDAGVREILAETAAWKKVRPNKEELVSAHVPPWVVAELLARRAWPSVRVLEAVVTNPVVRPDGTILMTPGYDEKTGILYLPAAEYAPIPEYPDEHDARSALAEIEDVLCDFPFANSAHRAAAIAGILDPLACYAHGGPSPLKAIDATNAGSGKGLLADVIAHIALGRPMARMPQANSEEEERKRILAIALSGTAAVLIDNINKPLGSGALDAALTTTEWSDRVLGVSKNARAPLRTSWYCTGNNLQVVGDTARRMLSIRLEPTCERPELREGFRHPDLLAYVRAHRPRLLRAALIILRAYFAAGSPDLHLPAWGSFEGWSRTVRAALVFAGASDPGATRTETRLRSDAEANAVSTLLKAWPGLCAHPSHGRAGATAAEAVRLLVENPGEFIELKDALAELTRMPPGGVPSSIQLGYVLRKYRGRVVRGRRIEQEKSGDRCRWFVEIVDAAEAAVPITTSGDTGDDGDATPADGTRASGSTSATPYVSAEDHHDPDHLRLVPPEVTHRAALPWLAKKPMSSTPS